MGATNLIPDDETPEQAFEKARAYYPQKMGKRGFAVELANFQRVCRKYKLDWKQEAYDLYPAIKLIERHREQMARRREFVPDWAYFPTWINNARWQGAAEI